MDMTQAIAIFLTIATAATPLALAALGELVVERSGVLNLGVEGMMIMGAVCAFAISYHSGNPYLGALAGIAAGAVFSLLFALLVLKLATNQVASGLALTLLGLGVSGMIGEKLIGLPGVKMQPFNLGPIGDIPVLGPLLEGLDPLFYASIMLIAVTVWFLFKTRAGLTLRAVGDNHHSAHALGVKVIRIRLLAIIFGGACAGLAGAHLSLIYTPQWTENMTAGRGWIALALVVFASWRPWRLLAGAYLFGAVSIGQLHAQAFGIALPSQFLSALPYIATIVVLTIISGNKRLMITNTPAVLGKPFVPDR